MRSVVCCYIILWCKLKFQKGGNAHIHPSQRYTINCAYGKCFNTRIIRHHLAQDGSSKSQPIWLMPSESHPYYWQSFALGLTSESTTIMYEWCGSHKDINHLSLHCIFFYLCGLWFLIALSMIWWIQLLYKIIWFNLVI